MFSKVFDWPFLKEPLWRWFVFLVAISLFAAVWSMILGYMKVAG